MSKAGINILNADEDMLFAWGVAAIQLSNGRIRKAELHWYEAHGIGKKGNKA